MKTLKQKNIPHLSNQAKFPNQTQWLSKWQTGKKVCKGDGVVWGEKREEFVMSDIIHSYSIDEAVEADFELRLVCGLYWSKGSKNS